MIQSVKRIVLVAGLLTLAACASYRGKEQRTTQGPLAEDLWINKISQYLHRNQDSANSIDVSTFRFIRQVSVGQSDEQVLILLGPPIAKTADEAEMEKLARKYWPSIKGTATEAWVYPAGWRVYFKDSKVVDITQYFVP